MRARARGVETGQGMGGTLQVTVERRAYTLSDRGTYLSHQAARQLRVVFENGAPLLNVYHTYLVNPARHPAVDSPRLRIFSVPATVT